MLIRLVPWHVACLLGWIVYVVIETFFGYNAYLSDNPICHKEGRVNQGWYFYICCGITGGFFIIWVILLSRITQKHTRVRRLDRSAYFAYFNVVSMGLATAILSLTFGWGGLCVDYFG